MTSISFTSGELFDIISTLCDKGEALEEAENYHLADYYCKIAEQFSSICEKLQELPGEQREANLILAMN